jgi:sigma-B regulation protein RsbU (phosphoserine phosphatase)
MVAARWVPAVELGFDNSPSLLVTGVYRGSPAEKAGLLPGDQILAIDGIRLEAPSSLFEAYAPHKPGDTVQLTVARPGQTTPVILTGVFRRRVSVSGEGRWTEYFAEQVRNSFPAPFVVVGLTVLFFRLEDPKVWLLALMCAGWASTPGLADTAAPELLQRFALAYRSIFLGLFGSLFYFFFAVFPTRSPLDRRLPWLKWVSLASGIGIALPGLRLGQMRLPPPLPRLLGESVSDKITFCYSAGLLILGLISLAATFFRTSDPEARRKIRVIFWGTGVGIAPALVLAVVRRLAGFQPSLWLITATDAVLFLFPLSFAYAVVKHRVLEIPVLLRRSARYLLVQRGFTFLLSLMSIGLTLLFALSFPRYLQAAIDVAQPSGIALGAVFGTILLWGGLRVHKQVSGKIDRAFFRSAYDARVILEDLAEKTRTATDRDRLARLLDRHLGKALQPSSLVVYLQRSNDQLVAVCGAVPEALETISAKLPILTELAQHGQPWEFAAGEGIPAGRSVLAPLDPDCLAPMLGRGGRLVGLLVLGPRLSEEPYSGEDKRLLASVASQAGTALENIRLAEEIAERMEAERRVAREMEIAKEVQARLLPQTPPHLKTLDCAARCLQARSVGGDYYDFLWLGPDHLGFVVADVSGKGVHAALLMASLQAHLRSQSSATPLDPVRLLQQVNRRLLESTDSRHFATLFLGIYEDSTRRLVYVNCGHNPPVHLRKDGTVERLWATATVIGLFEQWECAAGEVRFDPGDLLLVFSDGVTEAVHNEEEFGEARLIEGLRAHSHLPPDEIVTAIFSGVQEFSAGEQSDDLTLLVARAHT